jgi:23S rRNA (adenine2030-N6)-methyltransferase
MNYRHAYHAGNFADVAKHLALVAALLHLRKKDKPFAVIDSHGGTGLYDLSGEAAQKTGEAEAGIETLRPLTGQAGLPAALAAYLDLVAAEGAGRYPGSPRLAARMLRAQDRLVAIEKHPEDAASLAAALAPFPNAKAETGDGYRRLQKLLPPPERRGLILIDPPYEAPGEFEAAAEAMRTAWRRFATGIYMLWFPVKSAAAADAFCGEVLAAGISRALRLDIALPAVGPGVAGQARMAAAGLLVLNPPFGLDEEMRAAAPILAERLAKGESAGARLEVVWLAGEGA